MLDKVGLVTIMLKMLVLSSFYADKLLCETIEIPVKDPSQNLIGMIRVGINDNSGFYISSDNKKFKIKSKQGRVTAVFSPMETLDKAAEQVYGNHFNWINVVVKGENALFPEVINKAQNAMWIDPLPGGNQGQGVHTFDDDHHPFFWSEQDIKEKGVVAEIRDTSIGNTCVFTDLPLNKNNSAVHFETYLVSIVDKVGEMDNKKFYVVAGFSWKSSTNQYGKRNKISDLKPIDIFQNNGEDIVGKVNMALGLSTPFKFWQAATYMNTETIARKTLGTEGTHPNAANKMLSTEAAVHPHAVSMESDNSLLRENATTATLVSDERSKY